MVPKTTGGLPEDHNALIAQMYELAINPSAYEALVSLSDATVRTIQDPPGMDKARHDDLDAHAQRAETILSRLENEQPAVVPTSVADTVVTAPYPILVLSWDARVLAASRAFGDSFGDFSAPSDIEAFLSEASFPGEWNKVRATLADARLRDDRVPGALQIEVPGTMNRMLFVLHHTECPVDSDVGAVLCGLSPRMSTEAGAAVKCHFGLTEAEFDIVRRIIGGDSAQEIARARETSLQTVRTQVKSLLLKTGFGSQIELVRQLGAFRTIHTLSNAPPSALDALEAPAEPSGADPGAVMRRVKLASGVRLDYALIGPEGGRPVLFVHGMVDSPKMNARLHAILKNRRIRLVAPVRPHFGASSGYASDDIPTRTFGDRVAELLDMLRLEKPLPVIGHMAGALYAYHLAIHHPERVSRIVSVAGAVPMVQPWQFDGMSKGHRIAGLTARHTPSLLRLLTRGGIAMLRNNREDFMLRLAFHDSAIDLAHAQSEEMRALVFDRFRFLTEQGHKAFEVDIKLVSDDWASLATKIKKPVALVHGAHDRVVLPKGVQIFARQIDAPLILCPNSGQLVWSRNPRLAFDMLDAADTVQAETNLVTTPQAPRGFSSRRDRPPPDF